MVLAGGISKGRDNGWNINVFSNSSKNRWDYPKCRLKLLVEMFGHVAITNLNQAIMFKSQQLRKTLRVSLI